VTARRAAIALSAADIARVTGGRVIGDSARRFERVSIDSRTVQPGELFFAIAVSDSMVTIFLAACDRSRRRRRRGESWYRCTCGHHGASRGQAPVVIEVGDTTQALQAMAREVRRQSGARVIAITRQRGQDDDERSDGGVSEVAIRHVQEQGQLETTTLACRLSLLELRDRPEMAVVELGMSAPGEIRTLVGIAEPDVRVWTNVGAAHLESFPSVDAIADAKAEVLEFATRDSCLVMNPPIRSSSRATAHIPRPPWNVRDRRARRRARQ